MDGRSIGSYLTPGPWSPAGVWTLGQSWRLGFAPGPQPAEPLAGWRGAEALTSSPRLSLTAARIGDPAPLASPEAIRSAFPPLSTEDGAPYYYCVFGCYVRIRWQVAWG